MNCFKLVSLSFLLLFHISSVQAQLDQNASLTFDIDGKSQTIKLKDIQKHVPAYEVTLFNPAYKKTITYRAFKFAEVAKLGKIDIHSSSQISFIARDGYEAVMSKNILKRFPEPWLAFEELNTKNGEVFSLVAEGKEITDPAPFYLMWQQPDSYEAFPWPFAISQISVNTKYDQYFALKPKHKLTAQVERGYFIFKTRCMACHSINLIGGTIGPELNIPKNITEYRSMSFLKAWIKDPSSFRARNRMTNFGKVTEKEIDDVLAYIQYMKNFKNLKEIKK
ncbi:cytochrome c [Shewanella sp. 202IG2-18]|uniref:c-type cytochrome n=1 Tax=Parashewanella hymeniacidonis TaxID=2807618 RepID=UPI0019619E8D|nr:cytochrome c [Parashewanella hymeniacidonis]MBM7073310.1 cytochrome c [Parashewanella hymeniacidonis]